MKEKFKNKYRNESARLRNWDYGRNGKYFVTICTSNREYYFGTVKNRKVKLSEIGILADQFWLEIPNHFNYVKLDEYKIMPNHVHGIIIIDKPDNVKNGGIVGTPNLDVPTNTRIKNWKPGILGVIVNQYKRIVTINAHKINPNFTWQSRYYDHIIRNQKSLTNIRNYIKQNPEKWEDHELSFHV